MRYKSELAGAVVFAAGMIMYPVEEMLAPECVSELALSACEMPFVVAYHVGHTEPENGARAPQTAVGSSSASGSMTGHASMRFDVRGTLTNATP